VPHFSHESLMEKGVYQEIRKLRTERFLIGKKDAFAGPQEAV
jgi:hypothetical protein